jgi:hypothetical protein
MQKQRGMHKDKLGQLGYASVALKSFLCGFSFGSEMFLVTGIWSHSPGVAVTMLLFRSLHVCGGMVLAGSIFGSDEVALLAENVLAKAPMLGAELDHAFARGHVPLVGALALQTMCDVTTLQYLPWKTSSFYTESEGYPDMSVLKFALGIKTVQAFVSVICQLSYLVSEADVNDPTMGAQAKALFALNIMFSLASVMYGVMVWIMKKQTLFFLQSEQQRDELAVQRAVTSSGDDVVEFNDLYDDHGAEPKCETIMINRVGEGASSPLHAETVQRLKKRVQALSEEVSSLTAISEDLAQKLREKKNI